MSEGVASPLEVTPDVPVPAVGTTPEDSLSLSDHESRYGEHRQETQAEPETRPVETPEPAPVESADAVEDDAGPRDEKGRFLPKTPAQRRPSSHGASPEDVPRIAALTARLRTAEAERDALKAQRPEPQTDAVSTVPVAPADDPEPVSDQFEDYGKFMAATSRWNARQEFRALHAQQAAAAQQAQAKAEAKRIEVSFEERKAAARQKYADFDAVAINAPSRIPIGSLVDAWVLEHKTGADVLYHLQSHPDELSTLLQQPVLDQAETLALLAQRFNGHGRSRAVDTGSASPALTATPPPKPPNPVRTGPLRSGDEPPDEELASLADHEKWYTAHRRRA